jgi:regulator of nucleoside diphosphate kinase
MTRRQITLTFEDVTRLRAVLASRFTKVLSDTELVPSLHAKLDRARIVAADEFPADVVTMNSTVTLRDLETQEVETYTLVYPHEADIANGRLSVLTPVGTAILGCRVRDTLRWPVPVGWRRLKVEDVWHHPKRGETFESERGLSVGGAKNADFGAQRECVGAFSSNPS